MSPQLVGRIDRRRCRPTSGCHRRAVLGVIVRNRIGVKKERKRVQDW